MGTQDWRRDSACRNTDPEIFYPLSTTDSDAAKAICAICPVRRECLTEALSIGEPFGIWGGLDERERRRLLRTNPDLVTNPLPPISEPARPKPVKRGRPESHDPTRPAYHRAEIIRRVRLGQSWSPIADAIGCNPESVRAYIRRLPKDVQRAVA
jgi:WhiB family redox-sensing transcriptional regulator